MDRVAVESSTISAVGYDPASKVLEVAFKNGGDYSYFGVSSKTHAEMMSAPSVGKFFASNIRNHFSFSKR